MHHHSQEILDVVPPPQDDEFKLEITRWDTDKKIRYVSDGGIDTLPVELSEVTYTPAGQERWWWPSSADTKRDWCGDPKVPAEAVRRLASRGEHTSQRAVAGELLKMWHEARRRGGSEGSMRDALRTAAS
jgi:hypothetical protein